MKFSEFKEYLASRDFSESTVKLKDLRLKADGGIAIEVSGQRYELAEPYTLVHLAKLVGFPSSFVEPFTRTVGNELTEEVFDKFISKAPERNVYVQWVNGKLRALRTDKFAPIRHDAVIKIMNETLKDVEPFDRVLSYSGVESWSYIIKSINEEIHPKDKLYGGISVTNSEVGHRKLGAEIFLYREICTNGARETILSKRIFSKIHVGSNSQILASFREKIAELANVLPRVLKTISSIATTKINVDAAFENLVNVFSISRKTVELIKAAYKEEPIAEDIYGFVGALSRVATHGDISDAMRLRLSQLAGNILTNKAMANAIAVQARSG